MDSDNLVFKEDRSSSSRRNAFVIVIAGISALALLGVVAVAAAVLASAPQTQSDLPPVLLTTPAAEPPPPTTIGSGFESTIAITIVENLKIYELPDEAGPIKAELPRKNEHGVDQVFLVKESRDAWFNVLLPIRPNGSRGWIRIRDVKITGTNYSLRIHLGEKRLELLERKRLVTQFPIGIGRQNTPTPGGEYYIKELLKPRKENGPYGSFAYGLSGYSNVLESFNGGTGVIGIHGTNDPSSIGKEVSAGCIRMRNEDIETLVGLLSLGTPVEILAD